VSALHHFVPVVHGGDAVGRHTLRLRDAAVAHGFESHIYVDIAERATESETMSLFDYDTHARKDDVLVYQFATASYMAQWLTARSERLVVNYHNITPSDLMSPWDPFLALGQRTAEVELQQMVPRTSLAVADSSYNERQLVEAGFAATAVVPPSAALAPEAIAARTGATARRTPPATGARWLSVGRLAPNKCVEDTVTALAITRAHGDPEATLHVIGKPSTSTYDDALRRFVADLGLTEAVTFGGYASDAAVAAAYSESDVLIITSDHEGFCVPLVEAMSVGLPVVAFNQGAVPDVLGRSGVLVDNKDPYQLASAIAQLLGDTARLAQLKEAAAAQLRELDLDTAADRFIGLLVTSLGMKV
jgi:glycosyltransferase involved in cell wall biosynthesis